VLTPIIRGATSTNAPSIHLRAHQGRRRICVSPFVTSGQQEMWLRQPGVRARAGPEVL